jgi:hypothetical protein
MDRLQPFQKFLKLRRKPVVSFDLRGKEGVTTRLRLVKDEKEGRSGGLTFVRNIGVPAGMVVTVAAEIVFEEVVLGVPIDDVEFWVAFDVA